MKCSKEQHCPAMRTALIATETKIGLNGVNTINTKTGEMRYIGVRLITGKKDKRGTMLNFCPFCGESMEWWRGDSGGAK